MKRNKFIFSALVCFVVLILSCSKDESQNGNLNQGVQSRTITPNTINGMLSFSTYQDFEDFITNLKNQEQDSTTVRNAFISLGIDLYVEQTTNITDYPICRLTENGISGFTSARRIEEDAINADLNAGGDAFSIIDDVYLKTALNSDKSVHIGTRIFKFYDNGGVAIVLNNDWSKYNTIKTLGYENIKQSGNLIITNDVQESWTKLYNLGSDGKISIEKGYFEPTPTNPESPLACDFSDALVVTNLSDGKIRAELPSKIYDIYEWTFSDGTQAFGNPLIIDCNQKSNGKVTLDVWVLDPNVPAGKRRICSGTVEYFCNCGEKKSIQNTIERTIDGKKWRIEAQIWIKNGEIGCSAKASRKYFGIWIKKQPERLGTGFVDSFYKKEKSDKSCEDIWISQLRNNENVRNPEFVTRTESDKIFNKPTSVKCEHWLTEKGVTFGFGKSGTPLLIL